MIKRAEVIGFRGGTFTGFSYNKSYNTYNTNDLPHLAATYTSLCILKVCGYEYPENFKSIISDLKYYQRDDGSFRCQKWDTEYDSRFIYCACVIPKLLSCDSFDIDKMKLVDYLSRQENYEGGFGMVEGSESNAGLTYCTVASFHLLNEEKKINKEKLVDWLVMRQTFIGINGRTGKIPDSCYCFWVVATIRILGNYDIFDESVILQFLMNCQNSQIGGFSKHAGNIETNFPDILHSFYSLAALSLLNYEGLGKIDPLLAISLG